MEFIKFNYETYNYPKQSFGEVGIIVSRETWAPAGTYGNLAGVYDDRSLGGGEGVAEPGPFGPTIMAPPQGKVVVMEVVARWRWCCLAHQSLSFVIPREN